MSHLADSSKLQPQRLMDAAIELVPWMIEELRTLVELESPTSNKPGIEAVAQHIGERLLGLGFKLQRLRGDGSQAPILRAELGNASDQVLILSHLDTVWPLGTIAQRPFTLVDNRALGPGTADMKGGIVVALAALSLLRQLRILPNHRVVWMLTPDEETGSVFSRRFIEAEAVTSGRVLVTEPADEHTGAVKTVRKGSGSFDIKIQGVSSHSGAAHAEGASAVSELAHLITRLDAMTNYTLGATTNVGVVAGGSARNVVAESAWAKVDLRVSDSASAARLEGQILALEPVDKRVSLDIRGGITRPPMHRSKAIKSMFELAQQVAVRLGFTLDEASSGGASDANFTAALGIPTLDGLGAVGGGMHSVNEYIETSRLAERAALLAELIAAPLEGTKQHE